MITDVFAADGLDHVIWRSTQELGNDRELVDMVLSGEQWLSFQHFGEDAARTPDVHLHIVLLPSEHDLGRTVVSCGDISGHLRILNTSKTEIADFQVTVFVNQNVAGFQIPVYHTGRVNIFQTTLSNYKILAAKAGVLWKSY
jgi:hypothetical protein